jgi:hypothetical protein
LLINKASKTKSWKELRSLSAVKNRSESYALRWTASTVSARRCSRMSSGARSSGSADPSSGHRSTGSITRANSGIDAVEPLPGAFTWTRMTMRRCGPSCSIRSVAVARVRIVRRRSTTCRILSCRHKPAWLWPGPFSSWTVYSFTARNCAKPGIFRSSSTRRLMSRFHAGPRAADNRT